MPWCEPCQLFFHTYGGLEQHEGNSSAHRPRYQPQRFECDHCNRAFPNAHALHQHCANAYGHPYCVECKRMFNNQNNLTQHLHSRTHMGSEMKCPWCKQGFTTASGVTVHLESGRCTASGLDRQKINTMVQRMDRNNVITRPMLTMPGYDQVENIATERAWNGSHYECYLCGRKFARMQGLNQHLSSPAHEQNIYRCPKQSCGRTYKLLSGLIQHVESEACGVMRFQQVQQQAQNGIQNMVGRMIRM